MKDKRVQIEPKMYQKRQIMMKKNRYSHSSKEAKIRLPKCNISKEAKRQG